MLKYITIINWIAITLIGCLVLIALIFPSKGGDGYGRAFSELILIVMGIMFVMLLIVNLLPFPWAKYVAFAVIMSPVVFIIVNRAIERLTTLGQKVTQVLTYSQSDYDGSAYFADPQSKALLAAIFKEDVAGVAALLRKPVPLINALDTDGEQTILDYTATHYSPYTQDWSKTKQILELLIAAGATINSTDSARLSTHAASAGNGPAVLLRFLLDHGADPNDKSDHGVPIIFRAIQGGEESLQKVELLVSRGADYNQVSTYDSTVEAYTPLLFASAFSKWNICLLLIQKGADIAYKAPDGATVQTYVRQAASNDDIEPGFDAMQALINEETSK